MIPSVLFSLVLFLQTPLASVVGPPAPGADPWPPGMGAAGAPGAPLGAIPPNARDGHGDLGPALRSLAVPGWGQRSQGRAHGWAYTLAEGAIWGGVAHQRREGARHRNGYRDLAWEVARAPFWEGPRRDGPWGYYERMGHWRNSGRFDRMPGDAHLHPEDDEGTYNGMVWRLARDIHLPSGNGGLDESHPAFQRALDYYRARAIPPELQWSWEGAEKEQLRFRHLVGRNDDAFRRGTMLVGAALLNRFISGAEAWIASRPGSRETAAMDIRPRITPATRESGWGVHVRLLPPPPGTPGAVRP